MNMRMRIVAAAVALCLVPAVAAQYDPLKEYDRRVDLEEPPPIIPERIRYGRESWQAIQLSRPSGRTIVPLVVVLPDGSFRPAAGPYPTDWLRHRLNGSGFAVASVAYDPVKRGPARALADLAEAIRLLRAQAGGRGYDPDRVVLVGIGSGAHFAALLATDERYLTAAGTTLVGINGIVSVNGDGFDIPRRIATAGAFRAKKYGKVFGPDRTVQEHFSPVYHLAEPNAGPFLLLATPDRAFADQAQEMAEALRAAGIRVDASALPKFKEGALSTRLLAEPAGAGSAMIDFIRRATSTTRAGSGG